MGKRPVNGLFFLTCARFLYLFWNLMNRPTWLQEIENAFANRHLTSVQVRTFRPDRLLKMAKRIEEFEPHCPVCSRLKNDLNDSLQPLKNKDKITEPVIQHYLAVFRNLTDHLRNSHHLVFPFYYSSLFTILGLLGGILIWFIFWWIYNQFADKPLQVRIGLLVMAALGMLGGRMLGHRKDLKRTMKRIY